MQHVVGIGEMKVIKHSNDTIATFALGSCVGVTAYDPVSGAGGMVHCLLPTPTPKYSREDHRPYVYVDQGITALLANLLDLGAKKRNLIVCVAGASRLMDQNGRFNIGDRNYAVARKILWKNRILISAEDVGGQIARSMFLNVSTGITTLKSSGKEWELSKAGMPTG